MDENTEQKGESVLMFALMIIFLSIAVIVFVIALISLNNTNNSLKKQVALLTTRMNAQANEISSLKLSSIDSTTLVDQIRALVPEAQKGDKGDEGEQGEKGDKGDAGAPGLITQIQKLSSTGSVIAASSSGNSSVACPSDSKVLAGGCESFNGISVITKSFPNTTNNTWNCSGYNTASSSTTDQIVAHVLCYK